MPKAFRFVVALSVAALLLAAVISLAGGVQAPAVVQAQGGATYNTLRVYGRANEGAGVLGVADPYGVVTSTVADPVITSLRPEDAPYTNPEAIFNPQLAQAPLKDSVTWNPLFMSEFETRDENQSLYTQVFAGSHNATEKVWFRMWYEPWHWDKDLNHSNALDVQTTAQLPYTDSLHDEWYPAVMQEFTYMLMEPKRLVDEPAPVAGEVGQTSFVFPVGMRKADLFVNGVVPQVDATSARARYGYGLTSLDADFDGQSDIVRVESELTLFDKTHIAADFNGNGYIDPLDLDGTELNGNELAILRLDGKSVAVNQAVQFLDHMIVVKQVSDRSVQVEVWYTGDKTPYRLDQQTLYLGDMLLSGRMAPSDHIRAVANGGTGTNVCDYPTGPFFAYLESIDQAEGKARLWVGRALGAAHSSMEDTNGLPDTRQGDPWFLKRFYVDGHEYNVVALKTIGGAYTRLGDGGNTCTITGQPADGTLFKFITIRTPVPKVGRYADPVNGYLIEQHSVWLQAYGVEDYLSVMPPYNYEHYIIMDVQAINGFSCDETTVPYLGTLVGPVPPILQNSGPFPYTGVGSRSPYSNRREMALFYVAESKNQQFLGELREEYGESLDTAPTPDVMSEFWYVEQFQTLPWEFTEFVFPDLGSSYTGSQADLYLLTSHFLAPQSQALLWEQGVVATNTLSYGLRWGDVDRCWITDTTDLSLIAGWDPRVKFWFDPATGGKKYKNEQGLRIYGLDHEGPGDPEVTDPRNSSYPVEVLPYTDPWAPFNPQLPQAPPKDSLTFNPAYMDKYSSSAGDALVGLYAQISIREQDAREKVFWRMWYEPQYWDKILTVRQNDDMEPTAVYSFPAMLQEFTFMYLDTRDQPAHAQPGSSRFAFPMATSRDELPAPDTITRELPAAKLPSFGYGLTTFDPDFDGQPDAVEVHSEGTLGKLTNVWADFDGDGVTNTLAANSGGLAAPGSEMVVFSTPEKTLHKGQSLQFLDYMITLDNVSSDVTGRGQAELKFWYTGGGVHPSGSQYSLHPDFIGTRSVVQGGMAILGANRSSIRVLGPWGNNSGLVDGPWFAFVRDVNTGSSDETVTLMVGRALGHTHSAIDNGAGGHDLLQGDPWYLKRFFVDGHEYNVVALCIEPAGRVTNPGEEPFEFKYITIRTPVPKQNFVNTEDSQKLEGYYRGTVLGVDTSVISVLPPFNSHHTMVEDILALSEKAVPADGNVEQFALGNPNLRDSDCRGDLKSHAPYAIRIVDEAREPQFFGELKELYTEVGQRELWRTEQWNTLPDRYTELRLPTGQKYLLTNDWYSEESRVAYYVCSAGGYGSQNWLNGINDNIPSVNTTLVAGTSVTTTFYQEFYRATSGEPLRVKFLYDPADTKDVYINTWVQPGGVGTIAGTVKLQGRTNYSGALVSVGAGWPGVLTNGAGAFSIPNIPVGSYTVTVAMPGYLRAQKSDVQVTAGGTATLPEVRLLGGDADNDCSIDLFDLIAVSSLYGGPPPAGSGVDINGNGVIDIFDLVMVGLNLDKTCPGPWTSGGGASALAGNPAYLRVAPVHRRVDVGDLVTITLQLDGAANLYGVDTTLSFDPRILEVVDANPRVPGLQIQKGAFPNPADGEVPKGTKDMADNQAGLAYYAISLKNPAPAANGGGVLCSITFRAKAKGVSPLKIASGTLVDTRVESMALVKVDGSVNVGEEVLLYLPFIHKSDGSR